jgi:ADP-heptose:LPS heptosyltransferase
LGYDFPLPAESEAGAAALLQELGLRPGEPFVAVNAMTRWPTKNWTPAGFAAVAEGLGAHGLPVVFTGAPEDRASLDQIAAAMRSPMRRLDGRTSLRVLGAVFRQARVVVSTDTGPLHIAVAVGTPVVALFGPTDPAYTGPHGEGHVVLRSGVPCSPCFEKTCRTTRVEPHACMRRLDPSEVVAAAVRLAARSRAPVGTQPG